MSKENSWTRLVKFRLPMRKGEFCCFCGQSKNLKTMKEGQKGLTLIEVLIGVALLTIISVAAYVTLSGAMNAGVVSNKRTTAVSLANTIMENVKGNSIGYQFAMDISGNAKPWVDYTSSLSTVLSSLTPLSKGYQVYTLDDQGNIVANSVYGVPWGIKETPTQYYNQPLSNQSGTVDAGIQRVTIIIMYKNKEVFRLVDFKVNR